MGSKVKVKVSEGKSGSKVSEEKVVAKIEPEKSEGKKLYAPRAQLTVHLRKS